MKSAITFRPYQKPVWRDRTLGILVLHWSRQIGKSYTLAAWAVDRLMAKLRTEAAWLITVLSNSRDNGAEFALKCAAVCNAMGVAAESVDESPDLEYQNMRMEIRLTRGKSVGRIKVLAANPRTARGFSGDLILDEFAFHEDSDAIWEAAEPILSANQNFLCRIASTGNGRHNMFYRIASGAGPNDGTFFRGAAGFTVCRVTRTEAWRMGVKIFDSSTRQPITPGEARAQSLDKRAYDQNYECAWADENMALLTHELVSAAEREGVVIDDQQWSAASMGRMRQAEGRLDAGMDFGRTRDISVLAVIERVSGLRRVVAMLRMENMRSPAQQGQVEIVVNMPRFNGICLDMTGNGLGLTEYLQDKWKTRTITGVNFATTEPINDLIRAEGRKAETARVTENMATALRDVFEQHSLEIPNDPGLRADLLKPEKIVSPTGRVSIAAARDVSGHADHFWALALAVRAGGTPTLGKIYTFPATRMSTVVAERSERSIFA